jgi:hypothetical protein
MSVIDESMNLIPFKTPIDPKDYWNLSILLLIIGFCSLSYFIM